MPTTVFGDDPLSFSNNYILIWILISWYFLYFQCNGSLTQHHSNTRYRQSTLTLPEEKGLHEDVMNGNTKATSSHKRQKRNRSFSEASISFHVSMSETQINWRKRWNSVRELIYRESFIVGVDEFSLKLFSIVFITFNLYYWLTIFYYPDSVV